MVKISDDGYREAIWGIAPQDRPWFQLLTLMGGLTGAVTLTLMELDSLSNGAPPKQVARNITLGIGASFVASGFIAWGLLQAKEMTMSIADLIRDASEKRREKWRQEARDEMQNEVQVARLEGRREGYLEGYTDSQEGKPPGPPDASNTNGAGGNNGNG